MKIYELTYIISPEITLEEAEAKGKEIESAIKSKEGTILKQANPTAKTLAFPVAKRASGFFGVLEFQLESEKLIELKETVLKDDKITRQIIIIKKPVKIRKERRAKKAEPIFEKLEIKTEEIKPEIKDKVELKDIEHQLDELLGE